MIYLTLQENIKHKNSFKFLWNRTRFFFSNVSFDQPSAASFWSEFWKVILIYILLNFFEEEKSAEWIYVCENQERHQNSQFEMILETIRKSRKKNVFNSQLGLIFHSCCLVIIIRCSHGVKKCFSYKKIAFWSHKWNVKAVSLNDAKIPIKIFNFIFKTITNSSAENSIILI